MNSTIIFFSIIPLFVFVVVDSFAGLKTGLICAIALAFAEAIFSWAYFAEIDWMTWLSFALVVLMGLLSYKYKTDKHIKLQPVLLSSIFGLVLISSFILGKPLLLEMSIKYASALPAQQRFLLQQPITQELLKLATSYLGIALFLHAGVTYWAAIKLSNWWWIAVRGIGFYLFSTIAFLCARFSL